MFLAKCFVDLLKKVKMAGGTSCQIKESPIILLLGCKIVVIVSYDTHYPTGSDLQTGVYGLLSKLWLFCGFGEPLKHPPLVDSTATQPMGLRQCSIYHVLAYDLTIIMRGCS